MSDAYGTKIGNTTRILNSSSDWLDFWTISVLHSYSPPSNKAIKMLGFPHGRRNPKPVVFTTVIKIAYEDQLKPDEFHGIVSLICTTFLIEQSVVGHRSVFVGTRP